MSTEKQALGYEFTNDQLNWAPVVGAGVGGLTGAMFSKKKNMLRNALLGAATGGVAGGLGAAGYRLGAKAWNDDEQSLRDTLGNPVSKWLYNNAPGRAPMFMTKQEAQAKKMQEFVQDNLWHGRGLGIGGLGVLGGLGLGSIAAGVAPDDEDEDDSNNKTRKKRAAHMNTQKKAMILPALIGGGIGSYASPEGQAGLGFAHGAARGMGTDLGIGLGGLGGGLAGLGIGGLVSEALPEDSPYRGAAMIAPTIAGTLLGGGLGGYGGYHAGAGMAKALTGKKAPWQNKKKTVAAKPNKEEVAKAAAFQEKVAAIMQNKNLSLFEKAAAVKAAVGAYHDPRAAIMAPPVQGGGGAAGMTDDYMRFPVGDPNRTWKEWWDGQDNDLTTAIGIKKSPAALAQSIRVLENSGRADEAAKLRAALPADFNPNATNPYDSLSEDRRGMKPVAGSRASQEAAAPKPDAAGSGMSPALLYGGGGALGGAALGAMASRKNRLRNAIIGAALGGGGGLLANHLMNGAGAAAPKTAAEKRALVGTTLGAVGGLATGEKGKRLKSTMRGALKGLGTDVGVLGGTLGGAVLGLPFGGIGAIPGALAGGIGGGVFGNKVVGSMLGPYKSEEEKQRDQMAYFMELQKKMREAQQSGDDGKEASLKDMQNSFFETTRELKNHWNAIPEGVRNGLTMGGAGGAMAGGLAGLVAPGHEDVYDEQGNVVGRKQRSRFGAMARGILGGGAAGLAAGGAAGHFAPQHVNNAMNYMQQQGKNLYGMMNGGKPDFFNTQSPNFTVPAAPGVSA